MFILKIFVKHMLWELFNTNTDLVCKSEEEIITHMLRCQIITNPEWNWDLQTVLKSTGVKR